jgi:lysophospholipase L1-like esterase
MRGLGSLSLLKLAVALGLVGTLAAPANAAKPRVPAMTSSLETICHLDRTLPRLGERLRQGQALKIVAFGSSSTEGAGASAPEKSYPSRLQAILQARYPDVDIKVVNLGVGGEDAKEMLERIDSVAAEKPDLILWQVGTNAVVNNLPMGEQRRLIRKGLTLLTATGADVVLVDPQYTPEVIHQPSISRMIKLLDGLAQQFNVPVFHRYAAMRYWKVVERIPFKRFMSDDHFHMNDWSYDRLANLIADTLVKASASPVQDAAAPSLQGVESKS